MSYETRAKINVTAYGTPKKMIDLGLKECHWPIGHGSEIVFCGAKIFKGVYCERHYLLSQNREKNVEKYIKPHRTR